MKYKCPCCENYTFENKPDGNYEICPVCFWEDDPCAYDDPDEEYGCNNVSLTQAQLNYLKIGACTRECIPHVRAPRRDEINLEWKVPILIVPAFEYPEDVRELFTEYTEMLVEGDPAFREYLEIQNYDEEIKHLEIKYGPPDGRLYLAYVSDGAIEGELGYQSQLRRTRLAGCIGLKKFDNEHCEMKRLYVRPEFRNRGLGKRLISRIIEDAKEIGYGAMLLDTLPFLESAIHMYKKLGFYEIESYNDSPMDTSIYMKLDL